MKTKLILAMTATAMMAACTSNEVNEVIDNQEISFKVVSYASQTKANTDYCTDYVDVPFGAYAWFYQEGKSYPTNEADSQKFMIDETVSHAEKTEKEAETWKPSLTYYWPKSGSIDFISYSPKAASSFFTVAQNDVKISNYVINQNYDLMYADKAVAQKANSDAYFHSGVPTLFHHALAKINFQVKQSALNDKTGDQTQYTSWTIAVSKIEVKNMVKKGSADFTLNTDKKTWNLPEVGTDKFNIWTAATATEQDPNTINKDWNNAKEVSVTVGTGDKAKTQKIYGQALTTKDSIFTETAGTTMAQDYFVIPQELGTQKVYVTYSIITTQPNGELTVEKDIVAECDAKLEDELEAWQINKNITYTITIDPTSLKPITFDPAVADWDNVDAPVTVEL